MSFDLQLRAIVNPHAKNGAFFQEWGALRGKVLKAFQLQESQCETCIPESRQEMEKVVRESLEARVPRVLVVGGDGTFSSAIQGCFDGSPSEGRLRLLDSSSTQFAFFPGGRGNDFFRTLSGKSLLNTEKVREEALQILQDSESRPMDLVEIRWTTDKGQTTSRGFLNVASFGFNGWVTHRVNSQPEWLKQTWIGNSSFTYLAHTLGAAGQYHRESIRVSVDGKMQFEGKVLLGVVCNGSFNGGGLHWSREARMDDGVIDLILIRGDRALDVVRGLDRLKSGDWGGVPGVQLIRGKQMRIERLDRPGQYPFWETDGEQTEPSRVRVTELVCHSSAIRVCRKRDVR